MVALLKQKSKVQIAQKTRNSYPAMDPLKRLKTDTIQMENVTIRNDPSKIFGGDNKGQKQLK